MDITFYLVLICLFLINKANEQYGKIEKKKQYINYVFLVLIVSLSGYSISLLSWAIVNYENLINHFKNYVYMPQELSLFIWGLEQVISLISIFLVYLMIQRKEIGRVWLIRILPFMAVTYFYGFVRNLYETLMTTTAPLYIAIGLLFVMGILPFILIYYFYTRADVRKELFTDTIKGEEI